MNRTTLDTRKRYVYKLIASPVGRLKLVASDDGLAAILWEQDRPGRLEFTGPATWLETKSRPR